MSRPTIDRVREYFKDAKQVRSVWGTSFDYSTATNLHKWCTGYYVDELGGSAKQIVDFADSTPIYAKIESKVQRVGVDYTVEGTPLPTVPVGTIYRPVYGMHHQVEYIADHQKRGPLISYGSRMYEGELYILAEVEGYRSSNYYAFKATDINSIQNKPMARRITHTQAQSIIEAACNDWKKQLADKWATDIVLQNNIVIEEDFYQQMRQACTSVQNKLFDQIFGTDTKFKVGDWVAKTGPESSKPFSNGTNFTKVIGFANGCSSAWLELEGEFIKNTRYKQPNHYNPQYLRLATQDEVNEAMFGPDGTPHLVRDSENQVWSLAYCNGKGEFYVNGNKSGEAWKWKHTFRLEGTKLPDAN